MKSIVCWIDVWNNLITVDNSQGISDIYEVHAFKIAILLGWHYNILWLYLDNAYWNIIYPKNHGISKLVVWTSQNPAIQSQTPPIGGSICWFLRVHMLHGSYGIGFWNKVYQATAPIGEGPWWSWWSWWSTTCTTDLRGASCHDRLLERREGRNLQPVLCVANSTNFVYI